MSISVECNVEVKDEKKLWLKVIEYAEDEAGGEIVKIPGESKEFVQYLARKWLTYGGREFSLVCERAGYSRNQTESLLKEFRRKYGKID